MYGLTEHQIQEIQHVLTMYPEVEEAIIYGSRARGDNRKASDIDLTLAGDAVNLAVLAAIDEKLDDLYLPYFFDLSALCRLRNKDLIESIQREGKVFYTKKD